jgi:mRNA-degrading endonuclease YafQ of YafQ-DinJ toxin-antitoxin module
MKKYSLIPSKKFIKELAKLSDENKVQVMKALDLMCVTPFYPSLRTKKFRKMFESSVNMDIRIMWRQEVPQTIRLLRVGHHDIIRRMNKRKK